MKRRDLLAHFSKHACGLVREGARHSWWGNSVNGRRTSVPRHSEIGIELAKKICRDLEIPKP